ncbi:MAG: class I SAM-dependent methyltransferase [Bryobacteraceae bacterium]
MGEFLAIRRRIVQYTWERLARRNATYAILTDPTKIEHGWDEAEFLEFGRREVETILLQLQNLGLTFSPQLGLEYGCGIGRCTVWLETHFEKFVGVDISREMLARARKRVRPSTRLLDVPEFEAEFDGAGTGSVTFLYSRLVLQHNPVRAMEAIIARWCAAMAPGGVMVFQAAMPQGKRPGRLGPFSQWWSFLLSVAGRNPWFMEMHAIPRARVLELLAEGGVEMVDDVGDGGLGDGFESRTFFCRKPVG